MGDAAHITRITCSPRITRITRITHRYRAGYTGYPHASDFSVPLAWILPAFRQKRQLDQIHVHEYTCLTPTDPRAAPGLGPGGAGVGGYGYVWETPDVCNPCHPYFYSSAARRALLSAGRSTPRNSSRFTGAADRGERAELISGGVGDGAGKAEGGEGAENEAEGWRSPCEEVDMRVARMLLTLLEEEQRHNGTVCEWCQVRRACCFCRAGLSVPERDADTDTDTNTHTHTHTHITHKHARTKTHGQTDK